MADRQQLLHGTCVALGARAALLRGASGAGKSDLALRFLSLYRDRGAALIADDQVRVHADGGRLAARAPEAIAGRMEVRGLGIVAMPSASVAELCLLVDLVARAKVPRLPPDPPATASILGVALPVLALAPFEASAPVKLKLALDGRV